MNRNLVIIAAIAVALVATGVISVGNIFNNDPTIDSTGPQYDGTINLGGVKYTVNDAFCKDSKQFTIQGCLPLSTCQTALIIQEVYQNKCTSTTSGITSVITCKNKDLDVCGSGTGVPQPLNACTGTEKVTLAGVAKVRAGTGVLNYNLQVSALVLNPPVTAQCIGCSEGQLKISLLRYKPGTSSDKEVLSTQVFNVDPFYQTTQDVPFSFNYNVKDIDCNPSTVDDHIMTMQVQLFDKNGVRLENNEFSVGQSLGKPIVAGWQ